MSMTRRSVCKRLLLTPLAGALAGCEDLVPPPDESTVNLVVTNQDSHSYDVTGGPNSQIKGSVTVGPGTESNPKVAKGHIPMVLPDTITVKLKSKVIASKEVSESYLTNNGARILANSQLLVDIFVSEKKVFVFFQAQALGT